MSGQDLSIEAYDELAGTPAREVALESVLAGLRAAHPRTVVESSIAVSDGRLSIRSPAPAADETARSDETTVDETTADETTTANETTTVDETTTIETTVDLERYEDVVVIGGGNAAGHFAAAIERLLGDRVGGAVVTDDPVETDRVEMLAGDHPVPSDRGVESARRVLELTRDAGEDDLVIACLTGGGSALMPAPAADLSLADLRATTDSLLECGAEIAEMNAVRKHCSAIKGGRLAAVAAPATVVGLAISDVVGNDPSVIASGPLSPDPTTYADARAVVDRYDLDVPDAVRTHLRRGEAGRLPETPDGTYDAFDRVDFHVLADGTTALEAAAAVASDRGYTPMILSSRVRGEAREAAKTHVAIAEECLDAGTPIAPPAVLLSGGETTVTLADDHGRGGPNQEFVLSSLVELTTTDVVVASVDTDGIDGATDAAGAIVAGDDFEAEIPRDEARAALLENDAYPVLDEANALIRTGPSGTNVNDLRVIVIDE